MTRLVTLKRFTHYIWPFLTFTVLLLVKLSWVAAKMIYLCCSFLAAFAGAFVSNIDIANEKHYR